MEVGFKSQAAEAVLANSGRRQINCPHHRFKGTYTQIVPVFVDGEGKLVHCAVREEFLASGGCRSDGCIFLHLHGKHQCPYDR